MSEREELEAVIERAVDQALDVAGQAGGFPPFRESIATALINSGYTQGNGEPVAYLRDVQPDAEDEALFVCAKGDSGCFPVYAAPVPDKGNGELVEAVRRAIDCMEHIAGPEFDWDEGAADAVTVGMIVQRDCSRLSQRLRKALSDSEEAVHTGRSGGDAAGRALIPVEVLKKAIEIQTEGREMHPLTCPNRGDAHHAAVFDDGANIDVGTLLPTSAYLICVACGYQQDYSHPAAQFLLEAARSAAQDTQRAERATNGELHGDGVRDDTEAVQERVNAGLTIGDSHE